MDVVALRTALRTPVPIPRATTENSTVYLALALADFEHAVRREASADTEARIARRPSTLKASLKSASAVDRARAHLLAELRLVCAVAVAVAVEPAGSTTPLRLCT